tara:strand:- start:14740 stop:15042 length:303 start_codon:yes stop_codon:yes gene_type:complete
MASPYQRFPSLAPGQVLSPEDLKRVGEALFGSWGWQTRLSEVLEVNGSTVRRWVSGAVAVPQPAKVALRLLLDQQAGRPFDYPFRGDTGEKRPARKRSES